MHIIIFEKIIKILEVIQNSITALIPFVLLILILVFIHEMGHYFFARINGVRVTDFAIGFGPKICSFKDKKNTNWSIRAIPFGGYVKMFGDENISSFNLNINKKNLASDDVNSKSSWQKFLTSIGGPLFNFIFSFIVIFFLNFKGVAKVEPIVSQVQKDSLAYKLNIKKNDRIISINNNKISDFTDIKKELVLNKKINMLIERKVNNELKTININFSTSAEKTLGISSENFKIVKLNLTENAIYSLNKIYEICNITIRGVKKIITRELSASNLSGPIEIAKQSEGFFQKGLDSFLMFLALISVNLGMVNLFPIPVLDGGQALIFAVEGIIRRDLPNLLKRILLYSGYLILIMLTIFSFVNDLIKTFFH